jgi:hypothetical membrane protein
MAMREMAARWGPGLGFVGAAAIALASLVTAVAYVGTQGELFSPLNHWISELGEVSVSRLAAVFNVGLVVGGLAYALFMLAFALTRSGWLPWLAAVVGVVAGIAGSFVGVFPMDAPTNSIHRLVALTFFNLGWISVGLASIDVWRKPESRFSRWLPWLGLVTVVVFLAFLYVYLPVITYTGTDAGRQPFSMATTLEWLVLAGILLWTLFAAITWWRSGRRTAA